MILLVLYFSVLKSERQNTTKQILISYKGLPVTAIVGFYIFTLIYRGLFMKKKKKEKLDEKKSELIDKEKKQKKVE